MDLDQRSGSELQLGGAVDVAMIATDAGEKLATSGGLRQAEGDLSATGGALAGRLDLDLGIVFTGERFVPVSLVPERAWLRAGGGDLWLAGGAIVAPWRAESVDPWDDLFADVSTLGQRGVPGQILGGAVGWTGKEGAVWGIGGVDAGTGVDLLDPPSQWLAVVPGIVGARARFEWEELSVGGGGWWRPGLKTAGLEVDAGLDLELAHIDAIAVVGLDAPSGGMVRAEFLPDFVVSPGLRVEYFGREPGGALAVSLRPTEFLKFAAQAGYADGGAVGYLEAAIFAVPTSGRGGDPGDVDR